MIHEWKSRTARIRSLPAPRIYFCNFVFCIAPFSVARRLTRPITRGSISFVDAVQPSDTLDGSNVKSTGVPFNAVGKCCAHPTVNEANVRTYVIGDNLLIVAECIPNCDCKTVSLCVPRRADVRHQSITESGNTYLCFNCDRPHVSSEALSPSASRFRVTRNLLIFDNEMIEVLSLLKYNRDSQIETLFKRQRSNRTFNNYFLLFVHSVRLGESISILDSLEIFQFSFEDFLPGYNYVPRYVILHWLPE